MLEVTAEDAAQPGLASVLSALAARLDKTTLVGAGVAAEAAEAARALREQRLLWLERRVLMDGVQALLDDDDGGSARATLEALAGPALARATLQQQEEDGGATAAPLGVRAADLETAGQVAQRGAVQRALGPELEQLLHRRLAALASFSGAQDGDVAQLLREATEARALSEQARQDEAQLLAVSTRLVALQEEAVTALTDVVLGCKYGRVAEWDAAFAQWLVSQADAMATKMRLLELRLLKDTYASKETMVALRKMDAEILQALKAAADHKSALAQRKQRFMDAGLEEMERIAREYAQVRKATEETQWAINELKSAK